MSLKQFTKVIIIALEMLLIGVAIDIILKDYHGWTSLGWSLLSHLTIYFALGFYVINSTLRRWSLWASTFGILYIIGCFNILIEALVFNVTDQAWTITAMLIGIPVALLGSLLTVVHLDDFKPSRSIEITYNARGTMSWIVKIVGANSLYFLFYIVAGMILQASLPGFMDYYGDKVPPFMDIVITNHFFRGFVFASIAILIDRTTSCSRNQTAVITAIIFSVLGGIGPLLATNDLMPAYIRLGHGIEVGISNFLYGLLISRILSTKPKLHSVSSQTVTA